MIRMTRLQGITWTPEQKKDYEDLYQTWSASDLAAEIVNREILEVAHASADAERIADLESLMLTMADAWAHYRNCYEALGTGDKMTGRAWMLCTRAENKARDLLARAALRVETEK